MFEKTIAKNLAAVYFIAVASVMYYLLEGYLDVGVYVTYRHALALLIIVSGVVCFLLQPDLPRAIAAMKACLIFSMPTFVFLMVSLFSWCYYQETPRLIARGLSSNFFFINHFASTFAAGVFLYMFGEKGIFYNFAAILIANSIYVVSVILDSGLGTYMQELFVLIRTFAGTTGGVIGRVEAHELAFCQGLYLLYMILFFKKKPLFIMGFLLSAFYFISAFKRISIIGLLVCMPIGLLFLLWSRWGQKKTISKVLFLAMTVLCALLLVYIAAVKMELFDMLEAVGIDTMSRAGAYRWASKYYRFSPAFVGRGIGFLTYQIQNDGNALGMSAIHNDFLQYYVEMGFWGYILWLISLTVYRVRSFGRNGYIKAEIFAAMAMVWVSIVSSTDNTMRYPLFITTMSILIMGAQFDQRVKDEEKRLMRRRSSDLPADISETD